MQLDQDARQVCKQRKWTGFLGLYLDSQCYKNNCPLPKGSFVSYYFSLPFFSVLVFHSITHILLHLNCRLNLKTSTMSQVTLLLLVYNTGAERDHICRTWGQYNFETFDGLYYYFSGKSTYVLVRHTELDEQSFSIQVRVCASTFLLTVVEHANNALILRY